MTSVSTRESSQLPLGFVFSQSSLQAYVDCPRSFQLRYLARLNWPAIRAEPAAGMEMRQHEGQVFHALVQQHRLGLPLEFLAPLANPENVARWWKSYLAADLSLSGYTKHAEFRLSSPVGRYRLLAKYDLLASKDGHFVIYDWKTSSERPEEGWLAARWQTLVYRALLVHAGAHLNGNQPILPERITMVYWFPDFPLEPAAFPYDADSYRREWAAIADLVTKISSATEFLPATDDRRCHLCGYRSYCRQDEHFDADLSKDSELRSSFDPAFD
jgi:CRISPR/Cas system-associated exonuclease Cas4 (RecB family)